MKKINLVLLVFIILIGIIQTNSNVVFGSTLNQTQETGSSGSSEDFSSFINYENGKDGIISTPPSKFSSNAVYSSYERDGEFFLYNSKNVSLYTTPNGAASNILEPQVVKSNHRKGQWFLIDTAYGPRWIYNDSNIVSLRDADAKNANLTFYENVAIHSYPFSGYNTFEFIAPTTLKVLKQAGSWFLVEYNSRQVWITTENAKYDNTIDTFNISNIYGVPYKQKLVPKGNESVRPASPLKAGYITVHNTANPANGANAEMHANYLLNQAATNPEAWKSWHFTVDDKQIIQHLPLNEDAWHAGDGDGPGNRSSIGIEIAENADGNYALAEENAKKLISYLMNELNIPIENVKRHQDWSGKYCPHIILDNGWSKFISSVQETHQTLSDPTKYRIITGGFAGEANAIREMDLLKSQTGWWLSTEAMDEKASYYRLVSGEFAGEQVVSDAIKNINKETGWWMTYEKTRPAFSSYRIITGEFYGLENVKKSLQELTKETGWWATYEPTNKPDTYRIVTGSFPGEAKAREALKRVTDKGWWAVLEEYGEPVYYYRIVTGDFLTENVATQALNIFNKRGWWAAYEPTGRSEQYYRIFTGYFTGKYNAEKNAQWLRDTKGWWVTTQIAE